LEQLDGVDWVDLERNKIREVEDEVMKRLCTKIVTISLRDNLIGKGRLEELEILRKEIQGRLGRA
ncbi:MAG: hypothetical protein ACTSO9_15115, partial [Candidatus Helarchaeota archaeon]